MFYTVADYDLRHDTASYANMHSARTSYNSDHHVEREVNIPEHKDQYCLSRLSPSALVNGGMVELSTSQQCYAVNLAAK